MLENTKQYDRESVEKHYTRDEIINVYRDPLDYDNLLGQGEDETYVYRWVIHNNPSIPHRVEKLKRLGWEIVLTDTDAGQKRSKDPSRIGSSALTKPAGGSLEYVRMRILKETFKEREEKKALHNDYMSGKDIDGTQRKINKHRITGIGEETKITGGTIY